MKSLEMLMESYPQMILSVFIIQGLQVKEWLNITSCAISAFSVVYGFAELMALFTHGPATDMDYPISKVLYAMLAIVIDVFLRALTQAYLMTFLKAYILLIPLFYFIIMFVINICTAKENLSLESCGSNAEYTAISFGCSAYDGKKYGNYYDYFELKIKLRKVSKLAYSIVLVGFAIYFGMTIAPELVCIR